MDRGRDDPGGRAPVAAQGVRGRQGDRRRGELRHPRRHRRPHAPGHAVHGHGGARRLRDRDHRRGARRNDDRRRLRHPVARRIAGRRAPDLAREGRGEGGHRLRLSHDHVRRERRVDRGDGEPRPGRHHVLQALHRLPGRPLQRRRPDPPRDAARARPRRARFIARGERHRDQRPRSSRRWPGERPLRSTTR